MSKKSKNPRKAAGDAKKQAKAIRNRYNQSLGAFGETWQVDAPIDAGAGPFALATALRNRDAKAVAAALDLPHLNKLKMACYTGSGPVGGLSALHVAAYFDDLASVEVLLNAGFDANARTTTGTVPLHHTRDPQIIKALVAAGANVNAVENTGMSALMIATAADSLDAVHALLAAGADPDVIGGVMQESALSVAQLVGNHAIEQVLAHVTTEQAPCLRQSPYVTVGHGFTMLHNAAAMGSDALVNQCLEMGASPDVTTESGMTPLLVALLNGHGSTARILWDHKAQKLNPTLSPITDEEFAAISAELRHVLESLNYQLAPLADA
ncbi:ankyrin repeat domain-containing protein [Burkholderia sp. 1B3(2022)]|uniref:ankyrin repeat domain-containing protein n=1 Tax=Burkholderia sp. 1B3(2022) TaxID=2997425 RepID=UPI002FC81208